MSLSRESTKVDLVSIRDKAENDFLTKLHDELFGGIFGEWKAWIGIRKEQETWTDYQLSGKWEDGLSLSSWTNWADGKPSDVS